MTANELAAIAMEPSGAISMVAATMALFIAISCTATGTPILNAVFRIFVSKTVFSFRRRRSRGLRTQQEPGTREADDGAGQHRSHTGTHDTENRNQKSIENDIEHAHDGI